MFEDYDVFCINLEEDIERRQHMTNQFFNCGIKNVEFISANRPFNGYKSTNYQYAGEFGVTLSQLKAINVAKKHAVIFEDDIVFVKDAISRINSFLENLPDDWIIAYLGGCPREKLIPVNDYVCKVGDFTQAAGWIIRDTHQWRLMNFIFERMGRSFPDACFDNMINDYIKVEKNPGYCAYPPIIEQKDGWSTLRQGDRNHRDMIRGEWEKYKP